MKILEGKEGGRKEKRRKERRTRSVALEGLKTDFNVLTQVLDGASLEAQW